MYYTNQIHFNFRQYTMPNLDHKNISNWIATNTLIRYIDETEYGAIVDGVYFRASVSLHMLMLLLGPWTSVLSRCFQQSDDSTAAAYMLC